MTGLVHKVDITSQLIERPSRTPNYPAEIVAFMQLAQELAENPQNLLQKLVEAARDLCSAGTAGVSLLETDHEEPLFRWRALAGVYASHLNNTMPRYASPCGTTIERGSTQLMYLPERAFPALKTDPPFVETLLVPFYSGRTPIGTVWVVSHDEQRQFDREDARIVEALSQFAAAGWHLWRARIAAEEAVRIERQVRAELMKSHEALAEDIQNRKRVEAELRLVVMDLVETRGRLQDRNAELERFEQMAIGRELKMIELEKEIERLKKLKTRDS